ncbi:hypothetical protein [Desertivirga xinjiangensis]|uniref:hypothetical protein n=1 Tax=Desertivirga xinjiangensis TaxID=539206 RepID=UPI00210A2D6B|nr:hypothetical protein [Pedobacter xinjiangensis]
MPTKRDFRLHSELVTEWWLKAEERANKLEAENALLKLQLETLKKERKKSA